MAVKKARMRELNAKFRVARINDRVETRLVQEEIAGVRGEIDRLQTDRAVIAQRLEQDVRSSLHQAGFSYANIALSQDAAEASARNLELVTDLYQRGAADIIQLVDAQNQALGAALAAANALYDFLIDALRVQRASGAFSLEGSEEVRDDFIKRLDAFAAVQKRESRTASPPIEPTRTNPREHN